MGAQETFYGGSYDMGQALTATAPTNGARMIRVREYSGGFQPPGGTDRTLTLPEGLRFTEGGPIYIISNGSSDVTSLRRSDNGIIGTVAAGSTGYLFLLDRSANNGAGRWILAGTGATGVVGDQGQAVGYNFGTASTPRGLATDLGTAPSPTDFEELRGLNFGNADVAQPIDPDNL